MTGNHDSFLSPPVPRRWRSEQPFALGAFGQVSLLIDEDNPHEKKFVIKTLNVDAATKDKHDKVMELRVLLQLEHKRIVPFYGFIFEGNILSLIFGYMKKDTLTAFISQSFPLQEDKIKLFTRQILEGLSYLHNCKPKIIHRDIKGSNILLEDEENIRLADFGLSRLITMSSVAKTAGVGTHKWMAPELFSVDNQPYDEKVDIWSTGCTVVEMATTKPPFPKLENHQVIIGLSLRRTEPEYDLPESSSKKLKLFLKSIFKFDPSERPSADELLNKSEFLN